MSLRSLLFVPGDSDRKLAKCLASGADAVILDLEDSVATERKASARLLICDFLRAHPVRNAAQLWVRINPLQTTDALLDLAAVMAARPDGIMQPKISNPRDVTRLAHYLDAFEAQHALVPQSTGILPIATETPEALFAMGGFTACRERLTGLTWGAEDLGAAIGATTSRTPDGHWTPPFRLARSLCLFGANAAGVAAIDTLYIDFRDIAGLRDSCAEARRDGFTGKLAIHPDQVGTINESFLPNAAEIARALQVVTLFRDNPGASVQSLDGCMLDLPHLRQAERTLARRP